VLTAIELDDQLLFETDEIKNVVLERDLSSKLERGKPTISE
jgi:hypothetical protein